MGTYKPIQKPIGAAPAATGAAKSASSQPIPLLQSAMGNQLLQQALEGQRAPARDEPYTQGCEVVTVADKTPEDAAERLLGGRQFRRYGPWLAWINGIEREDWTPGVTRLCVPPIILEDMAKLVFEEDRRAKEALKNAPAGVKGLAQVHNARRRQQQADLRNSLPDSDMRRRAFLDAQARASIKESADAHRARVEAAVAQRIGTSEVLVNAPDRVRDFFVLSPGVLTYLDGLLHRGYNSHLDLTTLRFHFDPNLASSIVAEVEEVETPGPTVVVVINPDRWNALDLVHRLAVVAHEAVHAVQDQAASRVTLDYRRFAEVSLGQELLYGLPRRLKQTPLDHFDPLDQHFTLEAIATRIEYEILVNEFHAEEESWQQLTPL